MVLTLQKPDGTHHGNLISDRKNLVDPSVGVLLRHLLREAASVEIYVASTVSFEGEAIFGTVSDASPKLKWRSGFSSSFTPEEPAYIDYRPFLSQGDIETPTSIEEEFNRLSIVWKRETAHLSSSSLIARHQAYQEIIGMGKAALPLILRDLREGPAQWFWALRAIAKESPIRAEDRGNLDAMRASWLKWGEQHRYL